MITLYLLSCKYALLHYNTLCKYDCYFDTHTDNDPQHKGADSSIFMEEVKLLIIIAVAVCVVMTLNR